MPRPLIYLDGLRELPAGKALDVAPAQTASQALTAGQIVAGANVDVSWAGGVLTISAVGGGAAQVESVADRLARLPASGFALATDTLRGGGPSAADAGLRVSPIMPDQRIALDASALPAVTGGADFDWIMTTGGDGANRHAFVVAGNDAGDWAGAWRTFGNWRGRWVYRHRDVAARLCFFDPETSAWTFAAWPAGSVFPDYPDVWATRDERLFAVAAPGASDDPPATGYANAIGDPLAFTLDFDFVPLTGDEILVAGSSYAGLNGLWRAATDDYYGDRYNERRFYRRAADGGGIIYYYGDYYGWILYEYGSYPGDGPPNEHSQNSDDTADPNHGHLAPAASGYIDFNTYSPTATTVTVTA